MRQDFTDGEMCVQVKETRNRTRGRSDSKEFDIKVGDFSIIGKFVFGDYYKEGSKVVVRGKKDVRIK